MIIYLLLISGFAWSFDSAKLQCISEGKIRFQYAGKEVLEKSAYCFDESRSIFLAKPCLDSKKCAARQAKVCGVGAWIFKSNFGTPGFKLCRAAQGDPQLLEFFDGKRWWSMDRCYFKADETYVDTGILLEMHRGCPNH